MSQSAPAAERKAKRRFWRSRSGATAVEFAIVGLPFFTLLSGIAELGCVFIAQSTLDFAVAETTRNIRTGEVTNGGVTRGELEQEICDQMNQFLAVACGPNLVLDVRAFQSFADLNAADPAAPADGDSLEPGMATFNPGVGGDVVLARAFYTWDLITPVMSAPLANLDGDTRMLESAALFRNEPF